MILSWSRHTAGVYQWPATSISIHCITSMQHTVSPDFNATHCITWLQCNTLDHFNANTLYHFNATHCITSMQHTVSLQCKHTVSLQCNTLYHFNAIHCITFNATYCTTSMQHTGSLQRSRVGVYSSNLHGEYRQSYGAANKFCLRS